MDKLDSFTERRRALSNKIRSSLDHLTELSFQKFSIKESHSHHLLPVKVEASGWNRDDLISKLFNNYRIKCVIQYYPLNRYDLFKKLNFETTDLTNTDIFYDNMLSIPFSITLSDQEVDFIIESIIKSIQELNS